MGLSGGVDSAVTAMLLKKQGYEVIGAFMRCFSEKSELNGECSYLEDKKDAQKIAAQLNIQFIELDYEKEYKTQVLDEMFYAYEKGITPNPDAQCNVKIKFPFLWKEAKKHDCQFIATGHYVQKINKNNQEFLKIPKDKSKDQTYFLYGLTQQDLKHSLFPIGKYTKKQVRQIAKANNLFNWDKKGTKGLCFVGNINLKKLLKQKIKNKPGNIISHEGKIIGKHQGIQFYTIGERIKEEIELNKDFKNKVNSKLYVAEKNINSNTLTIAPKNHPILFKKQFQIRKINYLSETSKFSLNNINIRIRHLGQLINAKIEKKSNKTIVTLKQAIQGIAKGQSAVIYTKQGVMLGGGEIA